MYLSTDPLSPYHNLCKSSNDLRRSSLTLHDRPTGSTIRFCLVTASRNSSSGDEEKDLVEVAIPAAAAHVRVVVAVFVEFESSVCVVDNILVIAAAGGTKDA
jgi:hypothetical protein